MPGGKSLTCARCGEQFIPPNEQNVRFVVRCCQQMLNKGNEAGMCMKTNKTQTKCPAKKRLFSVHRRLILQKMTVRRFLCGFTSANACHISLPTVYSRLIYSRLMKNGDDAR